jgi:hypothetical protein
MNSLWDAAFRGRLLRQALSTDEIAQAVEAAEKAEESRQRLLTFVDAVSPFVRDVLDEPFPWQTGGQVITWMHRAEYEEAVAALEALRD